MDLNTLWFILISVLFIGFFFLEGFDFGVGILLPFIAKQDNERRMVINSIGPFWDGNEVWLITAGGAIFAAFPNLYATMFSGFYLALLLILAALILRGVAFEFRSKREGTFWRTGWDYIIFGSSLILAVLWGVALANLLKGVPIDKTMNYVGGFFDLISLYTLAAGLAVLILFIFHGAVFLSLKTEGKVREKAESLLKLLGLCGIFASVSLFILTALTTDAFLNKLSLAAAFLSMLLLVLNWYLVIRKELKKVIFINGLIIALGISALFIGLYPRLMVSSIRSDYSLTIYNAASSHKTLSLMSKLALTFVPIVLLYQGWTYYIFRKRVTFKELEY